MQERYKYLSSKTALQEKLLKRTPKKDTYFFTDPNIKTDILIDLYSLRKS